MSKSVSSNERFLRLNKKAGLVRKPCQPINSIRIYRVRWCPSGIFSPVFLCVFLSEFFPAFSFGFSGCLWVWTFRFSCYVVNSPHGWVQRHHCYTISLPATKFQAENEPHTPFEVYPTNDHRDILKKIRSSITISLIVK